VKSAITQDHVAAIVDFDTNDATWIPYAAQQSVPVIPGSAGLGSLLSDDVFPVLTSPLALSYALVAEAKTYGTKVAIGYAAEIAGGEEEVTLSKTFGAGLGVNVVVASKLPSSAPDYTAFCQQVKQSGATSYTLAFAAATAKKITDQCYQQGVRIPQVLIGPAVPPSWISDPAFKGDIAVDGVAPFFDTSVAGVAQYRSALQQYEPSITHSSLGGSPDVHSGREGRNRNGTQRHSAWSLHRQERNIGRPHRSGQLYVREDHDRGLLVHVADGQRGT